MRLWLTAVAVLAGCSSPASPPPPSPPPAPTPTAAWEHTPEGFEPVVLPGVTDPCEGATVWVGPSDVFVIEAPGEEPNRGEPDVSDLPEGVAREVATLVRPANILAIMTGSYNGPGGEPLFRWRVSQRSPFVLLFDRRVSRARFDAAIRGAASPVGFAIRIGGVDAEGGRRCAEVLVGTPEQAIHDVTSTWWRGRPTSDGTLLVEGLGAPTESPHRLPPGPPSPLPGEPDDGVHIIRVSPSASSSPAEIVHAIAVSRWANRRYAWLPVAGPAPP